jgi:hypothetical protein
MRPAVSVPTTFSDWRRRFPVASGFRETALAEFLDRQQSNAITERLIEVYSRRPAKLRAALHRAQLKSLDKDSW